MQLQLPCSMGNAEMQGVLETQLAVMDCYQSPSSTCPIDAVSEDLPVHVVVHGTAHACIHN